jgi:hypothetical protein
MNNKKYLIIALIILVAVGAYWLGHESYKNYSVTQATSTAVPSLSPQMVSTSTPQTPASVDTLVQTYYNWYFNCINNHFNSNSALSPRQDCPFNKLGTLTDSLNTLLLQAKDHDPVLCAQAVPTSISFGNPYTGKDGSMGDSVYLNWSGSHDLSTVIQVGLQLTGSQWKISSITCPNP